MLNYEKAFTMIEMVEMKMTEEIAYVFFISLMAVSFAIGFWLQKHENKRNQQRN
jgi:hypothetical protein